MCDTPNCPWCGGTTQAEFVDIGVGLQQVQGAECDFCGATEMSTWHLPNGRISEVEMASYWYRSKNETDLWWILGPGKFSIIDGGEKVDQSYVDYVLKENEFGYGPIWPTWRVL